MNDNPSSNHRRGIPTVAVVRRHIPTIAMVAALLLCLGGLYALVAKRSAPLPGVPQLERQTNLAEDKIKRRIEFFDEKITPAATLYEEKNQEAVDRAILRMEVIVEEYKANVPAFVKDITSLSTRMGILARMPGDFWYEDGRVQRYVKTKFELNMFSDDELQGTLEEVISSFQADLVGNRNEFMLRAGDELAGSGDPGLNSIGTAQFSELVSQSLTMHFAEQGVESVKSLLLTEVLAGTFGAAAGTLGVKILAGVSTGIAAKLAAAGGAAAAGATAGGSAGLLAGPVGVGVGLAIGVLAGLAVDMWMTDRTRDLLTAKMMQYLTDMRYRLVNGSGEGDGLLSEFSGASGELSRQHQRAIRDILLGAE